MTEDEKLIIDKMFDYQLIDDVKLPLHLLIRDEGKRMLSAIMDCCPECEDRTFAIIRLRDALIAANDAIALNDHKEPQ